MDERRQTLLRHVVLITLVGSVVLAVIDPSTRPKFMSIASSSLGAYWALQKPPTLSERNDDDDYDS